MSILTRRAIHMLHAYKESTEISLSYQTRRNISGKSTVEMDFSKLKTLNRVHLDLSMTTQEPAKLVKAMEVVIMTILTMIPITPSPTLPTAGFSLQEQVWDHVLQIGKIHHRCGGIRSSTMDISAMEMTTLVERWSSSRSHGDHSHNTQMVSQEVRSRCPNCTYYLGKGSRINGRQQWLNDRHGGHWLPQHDDWKRGMKRECILIVLNNTVTSIKVREARQLRVKPIETKWVWKKKQNPHCTIG